MDLEVAMIDYSLILGAFWDGRWQAIVIFADAIWTNVLSLWWFGPLVLLLLITASRKWWMQLFRYVGTTFVRSHSGG